MSDHPLDKEFDIGDFDEELSVEIPEDAEAKNLDLIIKLALNAYKDQIENIHLIEPKNRIKYYEIAERFLGQAKDARYKRDTLLLKQGKMLSKPATGASGARSEPQSEEIEQEGDIPVESLYGKLKRVK